MENLTIKALILKCMACLFIATPLVSAAMESAECEERLKSVNERIASGVYPPDNVALATQMRDSIMQSCAYLTDASITPMLEGFEQLLPTRTPEEQEAYEQAKREQRRAEREAGRAEDEARRAERARIKQAEAEEEARNRLPVSPILTRPPTGKTVFAQLVERPDSMLQVEVVDWDYHGGTLRMLYRSYPLASQEGQASAAVRFYVVLAKADGALEQHEVAAYPVDGQVRGGLRRGDDAVVFQRPGELKPTPQSTLELRSIPDGNLLSTAGMPELAWTDRTWSASLFFRSMLEDGNLLFIGSPDALAAANSPEAAAGNSIAWAAVSPDGVIERTGSYAAENTRLNLQDWAVLENGNFSLLLYASLSNPDALGLDTEVDTPIREGVGSAQVDGYVFSERRVVSINGETGATETSPGFDRVFDWKAQGSSGSSASMAAMIGATNRLLAIEKSYGTGAKVRSPLAATGDRAGLIIFQMADPAPDRQADGFNLREFAAGEAVTQTHMQSTAEQLAMNFSSLAAAGNHMYVYGTSARNQKGYVVKLNAGREIVAYAEASFIRDSELVGLQADDSGVWIIRWARGEKNAQLPGIERVDFSTRELLE